MAMSARTSIPYALGPSGKALIGVSWALTVIGTTMVLLRIYGAFQRAGQIRYDFFLAAGAVIFGIATSALLTLACLYGIGNDVGKLSFPGLFEALKYLFIGITMGLVSTALAKLSIIALLIQVSTKQQKKRRLFLWAVGVVIVAVQIAQLVITLTQCQPYDRLWNRAKDGNCDGQLRAGQFSWFQGGISCLSDFILALYPISLVWNMKAATKTRVGFVVLMAGGILPGIAAVIRAIFTYGLGDSKNVTMAWSRFTIWAIIELWLIIILGSIPPLRPLFLKFFGSVKTVITTSAGTRFTTAKSQTRTHVSTGRGLHESRKDPTDDSSERGILATTEVLQTKEVYSLEAVEVDKDRFDKV
ncbi:hypothetical protein C1H76_7657 [Elsinoe australis]|uniref:Rhodopsin domain-containing protein n=1 Tax=Elsinoe australis TaxID=40998 RepID=A0A4U7AUQ1_9PEZI|nr:hypothetical protein C1H76_7657 [Elsinoe australis]